MGEDRLEYLSQYMYICFGNGMSYDVAASYKIDVLAKCLLSLRLALAPRVLIQLEACDILQSMNPNYREKL